MNRRRLAGATAGIGLAAALLTACGDPGPGYYDDGSSAFASDDAVDVCGQGVWPHIVRVDDSLCAVPHPGYGSYVWVLPRGAYGGPPMVAPVVGQTLVTTSGGFRPAPPAGSPAYRALGRVGTVPRTSPARSGATGSGITVRSAPAPSPSISRGGLGNWSGRTSTSGTGTSGSSGS